MSYTQQDEISALAAARSAASYWEGIQDERRAAEAALSDALGKEKAAEDSFLAADDAYQMIASARMAAYNARTESEGNGASQTSYDSSQAEPNSRNGG
jgi:hypothetical protein